VTSSCTAMWYLTLEFMRVNLQERVLQTVRENILHE
jgi:hypothetical protein